MCAALADLYNATSGTAWTNNEGWITAAADVATSYCSFFGATCDETGNITSMCVCAHASCCVPCDIFAVQLHAVYSRHPLPLSSSYSSAEPSLIIISSASCLQLWATCKAFNTCACGLALKVESAVVNWQQLTLRGVGSGVGSNSLSGTLPDSLGDLLNLRELCVHDHMITPLILFDNASSCCGPDGLMRTSCKAPFPARWVL